MVEIYYLPVVILISIIWILVRGLCLAKNKHINWKRELLINVIGNTAMFMPLGVVWPIVYKELNTHKKVIAAGVGFSFVIEILQLLFYDRVTDIDDLILNSLGFVVGYLIYLFVKRVKKND